MGPTKPTETYFFRGLWGWASTTWQKINALSNLLGVALHGHDGSAWQKLTLLWGYSGLDGENWSNTSLAAGTNTHDFTAVAAGYVVEVRTVAFTYTGTAPSGVVVFSKGTPGTPPIVAEYSITSGRWYVFHCRHVLAASDYLTVECYGATLNDDLYVRWAGVQMAVS